MNRITAAIVFSVGAIVAAICVAGDDIDITDATPVRPAAGRIDQIRIAFPNQFEVDASYQQGEDRIRTSFNIPASEVIAASSNPAAMQARLVELRQILKTLSKQKVKTFIETQLENQE